MRAFILVGVPFFAVVACSAPATPIRDFGQVTVSAVERNLTTQKELSLPASFQTLPQPQANGQNRADN